MSPESEAIFNAGEKPEFSPRISECATEGGISTRTELLKSLLSQMAALLNNFKNNIKHLKFAWVSYKPTIVVLEF